MGLTTIEWTSFPREDGTRMPGYTANLWWGCTKVHSGCDHCYAETLSKRFGDNVWGNENPRKKIKSFFNDLDIYQKKTKALNEIHRVFVGSMMDIFEKPMPLIDSKGKTVSHPIMEDEDPLNELGYSTGDLRSFFFAEIENGRYPNLMFLLLTKRPSNINKYIPESWKTNPPENVMFGTSPVDQETANKLIPQLLAVNGKRFLSVEPQLDEISFRWALWHDWLKDENASEQIHEGKLVLVRNQYDGVKGIDWVIQGGESGHHRRPFDVGWARKLRDQCKEAGIPYFFKQIDKVKEIPEDLKIMEFPK